jgi:hypothetical protein
MKRNILFICCSVMFYIVTEGAFPGPISRFQCSVSGLVITGLAGDVQTLRSGGEVLTSEVISKPAHI